MEILEKHPEPRQKGRPSFKLRSPRKGTPSDKQPVTTEAPGLKAMPPRSHRQHHENIPQTPRQWTPLNPEAEPWQPVETPTAAQEPSPATDPPPQRKPCLQPHRHRRHPRRSGAKDSRPSRKVHFPEEVMAFYRPFSATDPADHVQDWYNHFNPYRLFRTLPPQGGYHIDLDPEWTQFLDPDDPRFEPLHQRLVHEFYRRQQLAHQK